MSWLSRGIGLARRTIGAAGVASAASMSPLAIGGIVFGAITMVVVTVGGIFATGVNFAKRQCDAEKYRSQVEQLQRDLTTERNARALERGQSESMQTQKETDDANQANLDRDLAKRSPAVRCDLTEPDARRLR